MTKDEARKFLEHATGQLKGTRDEHQMVLQALNALHPSKPAPAPAPAELEKDEKKA